MMMLMMVMMTTMITMMMMMTRPVQFHPFSSVHADVFESVCSKECGVGEFKVTTMIMIMIMITSMMMTWFMIIQVTAQSINGGNMEILTLFDSTKKI